MISIAYDEKNRIQPAAWGWPEFQKKLRDFLRNFVSKGKPTNYYDKTTGGWDMLHIHLLYRFNPKTTNRSHHTLPLHPSRSQMLVRECFSKISPLIWLQSVNWSMRRLLKHLMLNHGFSNWISSRKSDSNNVNHLLRTKSFRLVQVNLGSQDHPKPISISERLSLIKRE